jgi:protein SCO1/2
MNAPPRRRIGLLAGVALAVALAGAGAIAAWPRPPPPLPALGAVPEFALRTHDGGTLSASDLRGTVWAAGFVFTRCETICPVITAKMRRVQDATRDLGPAFRLVSLSVDPEHDTPEVLAAYAREHGADPRRWSFLGGGDFDALKAAVVDGFRLVLEREDPRRPETILHASHVVLVDGAGRIRGYYDAADADCAERVARDARRLVEGGEARGPLARR